MASVQAAGTGAYVVPDIVTLPAASAASAHTPSFEQHTYREYVLAFAIWDESASFLADKNMERFLPKLNSSAVEALREDPGFAESNLMHGVNG